jgi:hypothetical protein
MEDRYFCEERFCNSFVDKNHRCEQWSNTVRIPAEAIETIRAEALKDAADRAVKWLVENMPYSFIPRALKASNSLKAAIYAGEVKE